MDSGSPIVVSEGKWADKGKSLAHEPEGQRAFDEQEAKDRMKGQCTQGPSKYCTRVTESDFSWAQLISINDKPYVIKIKCGECKCRVLFVKFENFFFWLRPVSNSQLTMVPNVTDSESLELVVTLNNQGLLWATDKARKMTLSEAYNGGEGYIEISFKCYQLSILFCQIYHWKRQLLGTVEIKLTEKELASRIYMKKK